MKGYERDFRSRLSADQQERLEAWGRCATSERRPGVSPTWEICERLKRAAGVVPEASWSEGLSGEALRDAAALERAWVVGRMNVVEKQLLAGYYVHHVRPPVLCRALGVRLREFDDKMYRAVCALFEALERLATPDKGRDN